MSIGLKFRRLPAIALAVLFFVAFPTVDGLAQSPQPYPEQSIRDCDCRAMGRFWRQGQHICLSGRRFVCGMDSNVASWISTGTECPEATRRMSPRTPI
jgi:hypothetical protein